MMIMSGIRKKAEELIDLLGPNVDVFDVRQQFCDDEADWFRLSAKAYKIHLRNARQQRKIDETAPHVISTSNSEIREIINVNSKLADYALCMPATATMREYMTVKALLLDMPTNEKRLINLVESAVMHPRVRALQKKGRFEHFAPFKEFVAFIEAATLCYFRGNYLSSCLTLMPVIEGIMSRWMGYNGTGRAPKFKELRRFFSTSHVRNPCPGNPLFHEVYSKACDRIVNEHLYKPTQAGSAYAEFNRHIAAHLFTSSQFATKENCIRLFLLVDIMSELYYYETYCDDPRLYLSSDDIFLEFHSYTFLHTKHAAVCNPEQLLLGGSSPP